MQDQSCLEKRQTPLQAPARLWTTVHRHGWELLRRQCLLPTAKSHPNKSTRCAQHQVVCCRYPSGITNTEQEECTWVGWGISNSVSAFFFYDLIAATLFYYFIKKGHQASLWPLTPISNPLCTKVTPNTYSGLKPNLENCNMVVCMHLCMLNKSTSRIDLDMPFYEEWKKPPPSNLALWHFLQVCKHKNLPFLTELFCHAA